MISQQDLAELKKKLEATKKNLEDELIELKAVPDMGDDVDGGDEEADEAEAFSANQGMVLALKKRHEKVVHALSRMDKGTYGKCEACAKEIELELLKVDPESELCKADKKNK